MDFPSFQGLQHTSLSHPSKSKERKQHVPKVCGNTAMKKHVIQRLWVTQEHVASVGYTERPPHKITRVKQEPLRMT